MTTTTTSTIEQVAFAIATMQVGQDGTVELNGTTVEYRRHAPDRYEIQLPVGLPLLGVFVDHYPGKGWAMRSRFPSGLVSFGDHHWPTAQQAIVDALRYLVVWTR